MSVVTLESVTGEKGFITDGDWIESKHQDPAGTVRLIQLADVGDGRFLNKSQRFVNDETVRRLSCTLLREGDVLIARMPDPLGRTCVFPKLERRAITAVDICIVRPDPLIADSDWLSFRLNADDLRNDIQSQAQGATRARVPTAKLKRISFHLPPLPKQRRIVACLKEQLANVDAALQATRAQADDIALLRRRVLAEVFAVIDDVPRKRLGDRAATTSGSTPPRGVKAYWAPAEVPWVKTGEVVFAPITRTAEAVSQRALAECALTLLPPGTVLVAMYGQGKTRGQSAILSVAATTNQACFAILPNETWEPSFLFHWLMASYHDLRKLSEGRGGNQANLNGALLNALEVPTPSPTQQAAIARRAQAVLRDVEALAASNQAQRAELERLPQRLLAQAFED